jgi:adenylate cyclase
VEEDASAPAAVAIERAAAPQGAAPDAAMFEASVEPPLLPDTPLIAAPPFHDMELDADRDYGADALPAVADPAPLAKPTASIGWRPAQKLSVAVVMIGLASAAAVWWSLSSSVWSPTPYTKESIALTKEPEAAPDRLTAAAPSIIVLPFINLSGDAAQDYMADGVTDSLIGDLTRAMPGVSVVSRDTAFTYKGKSTDARQIGRELEVRYLLDGSVVVEGERVRVNIKLVETKEGNQVWSERFDTERRGILQVQDEIVGRVSRAIGLKVVDIEARRSRLERPSSNELTDLILRGKAVLNLPSSPASMIEARGLFEQALTVQPNDVDGLAGVATTLVFEFLNGYYETEGDQRLQKAELLLDRAGAIEPRHIMTLKAKAALRRAQGKFDDAIAAAEAVIMENPGEPWAYKEIGLSTVYLGKSGQALDWFAKADRFGPRDPGRWTWLDGRGHALIMLGRDEEAIRSLIAALDANPRNLSSHAFLAASYALLGRSDDARASLVTYLEKRPEARVSTFRRLSPVPLVLTSRTYQEQHERLKAGLRLAGMPE